MKHRKHRKSSRRRHHRNPGALMVNPRRGRRRHRIGRRRRGNPGAIREGIGLVLRSLIPAIVGGGLLGFLDAKFGTGRGTAIRTIGKGVFAGLVGVLGQKYLGKTGAGVAVGAVLGSIGYEGGFRLGGGVVAGSKPAALRELMADPGDDQEVRAAMGLLEPSQPGMGDQMGQSYEQAITAGIGESYQSALDTNYAAQGVGDDMGDDD